MHVLTQQKHSAVVVLKEREGTQHEIQRKTEVDRKTVKPSERLPGRWQPKNQIPPWPPALIPGPQVPHFPNRFVGFQWLTP